MMNRSKGEAHKKKTNTSKETNIIKKIKNMSPKTRVKYILFGAILLTTVGYAAINTSLGTEGLVSIKKNNIFKVFFSDLKIDGVDSKNLISSDGTSFTFSQQDIKKLGQSTIDYDITNISSSYDAEVTINCTPAYHKNTALNFNSEEVVIKSAETSPGTLTASTTVSEKEKLYDRIKNQLKGTEALLNYSAISSTSNGQGIYSTTNTDSGNTVYFYRGDIDGNNVMFASYCWKIIRTTETGGVKLLYNGEASGGKCGKLSGTGIASITYQPAGNDNAYAGYMYGRAGSGTYAATHANTNSSKLKQEIDNWYKNNLLNTENEKYLEDTVWCNDRSIPSDKSNWSNNPSGYNQMGYQTNKTLYGFALRGGSYVKTTTPTLKCANTADKFTVETTNGNGALTYPIATLTADEAIYAGATGGFVSSEATSAPNRSYFLYNENNTLWTMTPSLYSGSYIQGVAVFSHGGLSSTWTNIGGREMGVRPSISLKEGTTIVSGDGTSDTPYVIGTASTEEEIDNTKYTCKLEARKIEDEEKLIGTEYCFGEECFNIIGYDGENFSLLTKYNLYVGKKSDSSGANYSDISESEKGYGIQNPLALGDKGMPRYGTIAFGTTNEYSTSYVKPHVDNYVNYLNTNFNINATGRLINVEELLKIGCVLGQGNSGCSSTFNKNHEWLLRTTFWTGEKGTTYNSIYLVGGDGFFAQTTGIDNVGLRGIRPVIIVPKDKVDIETSVPSNVPTSWQDNGIFSTYYEQAYEKLQTMSLKEKVGQLMIVRYNASTTPEDAVKNYFVSGTTFYAADFTGKTEAQVKSMTSTLQANAKIPLITAVDEEGGKVIRVSSNSNLVAEPFKSSQELYQAGGLTQISTDTVNKSAILYNLGLNMNFAPVVDIAKETSYIYPRTLGQSPAITGQYATTVVNASKNTGVSYSLKHFPGYGNNADTHTSSSTDNTSLEELWNTHLVPFKAGIEGGAEAVMISHNIVSALDKENPSSLSEPVHNLLFNDLKFTGIAITDDLDMDAAKDVPNNYTKAILAGNNIILCSNYVDASNELVAAVTNNTISEEYLNKKVFKVLAWKYYKGLLK